MEARSCAGKAYPSCCRRYGCCCDLRFTRFRAESRHADAGAERRPGQADSRRSYQRAASAGLHGRPRTPVKCNIDNLLRLRLKEPGIAIRFGGNDTVDLKQVDWVEIVDSQDRKFRLAVDRSTHLLVRSVVFTKDEENQQINEDVSIYSKYQLKDSAWTPLQISREHNGRRSIQIFYDTCKYNPGFSDELFNKTSLSKQGSQSLAKKNKN